MFTSVKKNIVIIIIWKNNMNKVTISIINLILTSKAKVTK